MKLITRPALAILLAATAQTQASVEKDRAINDMNDHWVSYQRAVAQDRQRTGICELKVANAPLRKANVISALASKARSRVMTSSIPIARLISR